LLGFLRASYRLERKFYDSLPGRAEVVVVTLSYGTVGEIVSLTDLDMFENRVASRGHERNGSVINLASSR
jgi:predicted DNA-binding ribbon-helix-helix protein